MAAAAPPHHVRAMELSPVTFALCARCTTSDVMATVNTTRPIALPPPPTFLQERQRASLPFSEERASLSKPEWLTDKALRAERARFMRKLAAERADREELELWAATRIQAVYRGFLARPRRRRRRRAPEAASKESIRAYLLALTEEMSRQLALDAALDEQSAQQQQGQGQGQGQDSLMDDSLVSSSSGSTATSVRGKLGKKKRRRQRRIEAMAATVMQNLVRGYLSRVALRRLVRKKQEEDMRAAAARIQAPMRGYIARKQLRASFGEKRAGAATAIQAMARGVLARKRARALRVRMHVAARESLAAARIQSLGRKKWAKRHVGHVRTQRAAATLQARFRGGAARAVFKQKVEQRDAATLVQAMIRRHAAEKLLRFKRRDRASRRIQRAYRGHLGRTAAERARRNMEEAAAAVRTQSMARGWLARRKVSQMRIDAENARRAEVRLMMVEDAASDRYEELLQAQLRDAAAIDIQCLVRRRRACARVARTRKEQQQHLKRLANELSQMEHARNRRLRRVRRPIAPYLEYVHLLFPSSQTRKVWDAAAVRIQCALRQMVARRRADRERADRMLRLWPPRPPGTRCARRPPPTRLADLVPPPKGQPPPEDASPEPVDW